ncbi:hypothetical protein E4P40_20460 [Blastococcus sp. CT_GayMR20]|uniref:DUF6941 family protein n=1 Tax=Blastococcus sp. CT_GayMR20 TaxID=2559609 RepID=UPI0010734868|nr:hypothetical protein [Blastococcus sp. CT_GayMR20]TFV72485.1 hypothetical protein E4P40_20460 [Blastococcus sp. CT_GayMR20]
MLCDYAAVSEGKLYISGGGWSVTGPQPTPSALALLLHVPWDLANTRIVFELRLLHEDGQPVMQPGPLGPAPIELAGELEVGRPPGVKRGTPLPVPVAINFPAFPLAPGARYSWELSLNGKRQPEWHLAFDTRPAPGAGEAIAGG